MKLTAPQEKVIINLYAGRPVAEGFDGMSQRGGLARVIFSLRSRGILTWSAEHGDQLSKEGRSHALNIMARLAVANIVGKSGAS